MREHVRKYTVDLSLAARPNSDDGIQAVPRGCQANHSRQRLEGSTRCSTCGVCLDSTKPDIRKCVHSVMKSEFDEKCASACSICASLQVA